MNDCEDTFNVLASVEKHIESLKPLLPKQVIVCIGEYSIKALLREPGITKGPLPILIEKSSDEIYKWIPKNFDPYFVLDFEDTKTKTHFWYNVLPFISKDDSVIESLKKKSTEKLHEALIFCSVWDGIGSASLPTFISKFKASNIDPLSIALLPSRIQPTDAQFNTYAALEMCQTIDGATVLLMDRDHLESYEGVDRQGELIKGNMVSNYLVNMFLAKKMLVDEISELSRTFNSKLFTPLLVTGASYKIYGSLENMLNTALLKPFLTFDLSSASLLYVLLRLPSTLKDKLPRGKIELGIANWFKDKAELRSIYITEPIYTEDMSDRIDVVLLVGGFDTTKMFADLEKKVLGLKNQAIEKGFMAQDWETITKALARTSNSETPTGEPFPNAEEPKAEKDVQSIETTKTGDNTLSEAETKTSDMPKTDEPAINSEEKKVDQMQNLVSTQAANTTEIALELKNAEATPVNSSEKVEEPKTTSKPKRWRRAKKVTNKEKAT